jgi:myo-inositol-1(or 4)-monophosphatase
MNPFVTTAVKAARKAGRTMLRYIDQLDRLSIESKGRNDFVSEVDRLCEDEIVQILRTAYPSHGIKGEEGNEQKGDAYTWIIDPLDGTTNYLHGFPQFAVSIALQHREKVEHGVVFDPLREELFTASRGQGAALNDRRIRVSRVQQMQKSLLGTGFPFRNEHNIELWLDTLRTFIKTSSGIRRIGSAALDLAYVACGRLDGFWEFDLKAQLQATLQRGGGKTVA